MVHSSYFNSPWMDAKVIRIIAFMNLTNLYIISWIFEGFEAYFCRNIIFKGFLKEYLTAEKMGLVEPRRR